MLEKNDKTTSFFKMDERFEYALHKGRYGNGQ